MNYKRPPIIEAAIEFRLASRISDDQIIKLSTRLGKFYPFEDEANEVDILVDLERQKIQNRGTKVGRRLNSIDRADLTIVNPNSLVFCRLAPYLGWDQFIQRAMRDWGQFHAVCSFSGLSRLGVRYINRIDVPLAPGSAASLEKFFKIYPETAALDLPPAQTLAMQVVRPLGALGATVTLNMASIPSPLLNHVAFTLDFDIGITTDLPKRDEEMWKLIGEIRDHKNELFERAITDASRQMFNQ